jgi:hypothetical protein
LLLDGDEAGLTGVFVVLGTMRILGGGGAARLTERAAYPLLCPCIVYVVFFSVGNSRLLTIHDDHVGGD